ncbi:hypothetical protein SLE2022_323360 [Rubroshorea leprosula]
MEPPVQRQLVPSYILLSFGLDGYLEGFLYPFSTAVLPISFRLNHLHGISIFPTKKKWASVQQVRIRILSTLNLTSVYVLLDLQSDLCVLIFLDLVMIHVKS